jgi:LysM repeat protein
LSQARKRCPICDTPNPHKAAFCNNCGASLADIEVEMSGAPNTRGTASSYDFRYGETDLAEEGMRGKARAYLAGILLIVLMTLAGLGVFVVYPALTPDPTATPTLDPALAAQITNTPRPTVIFATVTQGSPTLSPTPSPTLSATPTITPSPEPCIVQVQPEEGMISLVSRCGHRHMDVIPLVVTMNSLNNENDLRSGQTITIPYPTATEDPNAVPPTESSSASSEFVSLTSDGVSEADTAATSVALTQAVDPFFRPTPTNLPGVQNYTVIRGDTITSIIAQFQTNINAMDMLNPDLTFSQCEMGTTFGGNTCIVSLIEGQILRVPAPTPTPTLSPTSNGSETPTPTATPTYNAPSPLSPSERAFFRRDEIVTLRWAASGALAWGEIYLVTVQDLTRGQEFTGETSDLYFVLPPLWQGPAAQQYEYAWTVAIAKAGDPASAAYTTRPLTFTWVGRGEE